MDYKLPEDFLKDILTFTTKKIDNAEVEGLTVLGHSSGWFGKFRYRSCDEYSLSKGLFMQGNYMIIFDADLGRIRLRWDGINTINLIVYVHGNNELIIDYTQKKIIHTYDGKIQAYINPPKFEINIANVSIDLTLLDLKPSFNKDIKLPYKYTDLKLETIYNSSSYNGYLNKLHALMKKSSYAECCICKESHANHILDKCKHLVYCDACSNKKLLTCPICRVADQTIIKIYIP